MTDTEKALNYYRAAANRWRPDYVPARILLPEDVRSDLPMFSRESRGYYANAGEHDCKCNQYGAVSVTAENGQQLGVKPNEFEVIAWKENTAQ
jgi:hypothetical protein